MLAAYLEEKLPGFPPEYLRRLRHEIIGWVWVLSVVGIATGILIYRAVYHNGVIEFAAVAGAVSLFILWPVFDLAAGVIRSAPKIYSVAYFENALPATKWVWSQSIARNCVYLDEIADQKGLAPISSFGFADDFRGEQVAWHNPEDGLKTITGLLEKLRSNPGLLKESDLIVSDLVEIENKLRQADKDNIRFCFILHGDGWNGMEVDQRKGRF